MATDRTVKVTLVGDADSLNRAFKGAGDSADGLGKTLGDVGKIAGGFLAATAIAKGFDVLKSGISDSIAGFKEQQAVTAQTNAVLTSTGGAAGVTADEILKMADALKKNSVFADDAIQSGENMLLTFTGIGKDVFPGATQAMVDMGQAMGMDMPSSAQLLGKALNDPVDGLSRLTKIGVTFSDEQKKQIKTMSEAGDVAGAQGVILAELSKEFGGSAKAVSDAAGGTEKYKDRMDDLQDTIGEKLLPIQEKFKEAQVAIISFVVDKAIPAIAGFAQTMQEKLAPAWANIQDAAGRFADFFVTSVVPAMVTIGEKAGELATVIGERLGPPLRELIDFLDSHKEVLAAMAIVIGGALALAFAAWAVSAGAAAVATIAATAPLIAIGLALTALVTGIILVVQHWDEITAKFPILGTIADAVGEKLAAFAGWITGTFVPMVQSIATTVGEAVTAAVGFVVDHWDEIRAVIEPALQALVIIIKAHWDALVIIFQTAFGIIQGLIDVFIGVFTGDWGRAWDGIKQIAQSAWDGIVGLIGTAVDVITGLAPIFVDAGRAILQGLWDGAKAVATDLLNWVWGLPGQINAQIPNPMEILRGIGMAILNGLLAGMQSAWNTVSGWVGSLGGKIASLKGPIEDDRVLLVPEGAAIMEGLGTGMQQGFDASVVPVIKSAITDLLAEWDGLTVAMKVVATKMGQGVTDSLQQQWDALHQHREAMVAEFESLGAVWDNATASWVLSTENATSGLLEQWNNLTVQMKDVATKMESGVTESLQKQWDTLHDHRLQLVSEFESLGAVWDDATASWVLAAETAGTATVGAFNGMVGGIKTAVAPLTPFLNGVADAVARWGDGIVADMTDAYKTALEISKQIAAQASSGGSVAILSGSVESYNKSNDTGPGTVYGSAPSVMPNSQTDPQGYIDYMNTHQMASGGIVRARPGGTWFKLGEGGRDEAVIPLDGKHGRGGNNITVYGNLQLVQPNVRNGDDMMRELDRLAW